VPERDPRAASGHARVSEFTDVLGGQFVRSACTAQYVVCIGSQIASTLIDLLA
jgi:hypothetical protein